MTAWDEAAIAALAHHLGCTPEAVLRDAEIIEEAIRWALNAKRFPAGSVKSETRRLYTHARHLEYGARILRRNVKIGELEVYDGERGPTTSHMERAAQTLEWVAGFLRATADPDVFRRANELPPTIQQGKRAGPESLILWPMLFTIWDDHRGRPGFTENGPLVRFVQFVHQVAGLNLPNQASLRKNLRSWVSRTYLPDGTRRRFLASLGAPVEGGN